MLILDANVWIAALNADDSQHAKASQIFEQIHETVVIPEHILIEVVNVLTLRIGKKVADQFLQMALNSGDVEIWFSSENFTKEMIRYFLANSHKKLSFQDQSLHFFSQSHKVLTFDKDLAKLL